MGAKTPGAEGAQGQNTGAQEAADKVVQTAPAAVVEKAKQEAQSLDAAALGAIIAQAVAAALQVNQEAALTQQAEMLKQVLAAVGIKPVEDDTPPPEDPAERMTELQRQLTERRFLITIQKGDKYAMDPVPIGVNGHLRSVKRGDFAVVTYSMLGVLRNAEETHIDPDTREPFQVTSYPYSVHCEVPKEYWDMDAIEVAKILVPDSVRENPNRMPLH